MRAGSILGAIGMKSGRKYLDYEMPDRLPTCAAEARTIAEHMDLVLRETQADMVTRGLEWLRRNKIEGALSQGQLSALRQGSEPSASYWPLYQAALRIDDAAQFYRLMRNSAKIAALQAPVDVPLLDLIEYEESKEGQIAKYKNGDKWRGLGGSDAIRGGERKDSDALDDGGRTRNSERLDSDELRGAGERIERTDPHEALGAPQPELSDI